MMAWAMPPPPVELRGIRTGDGSAEAILDGAAIAILADGHYPGDPILPGAHLLGALVDLAAHIAPPGTALRGVERCTFHAIVRPSAEVTLRVRALPSEHGMRFEAEALIGTQRAGRATFLFGGAP